MQKVDYFSSSDSLTMTSTTAKIANAALQTSFVREVDETQRRCSIECRKSADGIFGMVDVDVAASHVKPLKKAKIVNAILSVPSDLNS